MKWPLFADRSCQRTTRQGEKSEAIQDLSHHSKKASAAIVSLPFLFIESNILFIPPSGIATAHVIEYVYALIPREFCGYNDDSNVFNDEWEWEQSGLNDEYDFNFDVLTSIPINTIGATASAPAHASNFSAPDITSREFNNLEYEFDGVLSPTAAVAIVIHEKKIKMKHDSSALWGQTYTQQQQQQQQQQHPSAPGINDYDRMSPTGIGFCKFDNIVCIFDGNIDEDGFEYDIPCGMFMFIFFIFIFCFFLCAVLCDM